MWEFEGFNIDQEDSAGVLGLGGVDRLIDRQNHLLTLPYLHFVHFSTKYTYINHYSLTLDRICLSLFSH